jgi:hypothetical protein
MNFITTLIRRLTGNSIKIIELKFHKDANKHGTHGHLLASHIDHKLENHPVRFVFHGLTTPPPLTPKVMNYIWEEARAQGYIPKALHSYGHTLETATGFEPSELVSQERRDAEDRFHAIDTKQLPDATRAIAAADAVASITGSARYKQEPVLTEKQQ